MCIYDTDVLQMLEAAGGCAYIHLATGDGRDVQGKLQARVGRCMWKYLRISVARFPNRSWESELRINQAGRADPHL